jgi:hypothetical protein
MNDTANEVLYLTEDEKAKVILYHLTTYKMQEEQRGTFSSLRLSRQSRIIIVWGMTACSPAEIHHQTFLHIQLQRASRASKQ